MIFHKKSKHRVLLDLQLTELLIWATILGLDTPDKVLGNPKGSLNIFLGAQPYAL